MDVVSMLAGVLISYVYHSLYVFIICGHKYIKTERNKMKNLTEPVKLGEKPLQTVNQTVHLGIIRADKNETNRLNIQEHIIIARGSISEF
jgi:hypothetical protein